MPFYELDEKEFSFVNNICCRQLPDLIEFYFYNLLPNLDKNDEAESDMIVINPNSDYFGLSEVNNKLSNCQGKGISLFHCNRRSLTKTLTLLNDLLYSLDSRPDIIVITETRLSPNSISSVDLSNYHLFHTDSPNLAGGTALYVSKNLKVVLRPDLRIDLPLVESCWVEIDTCNSKKNIVVRVN